MAHKEKVTTELTKYSPKQAAFYFWYSVLGNATRAALKAYYPDFPEDKSFSDLSEEEEKVYSTAGTIGNENLIKHDNPIQLYLDQQGLDFKKLISKLEEGLEATKTINTAILLTKEGETIKAKDQGLIEVPDYPEQREWWDRFAKILGTKLDGDKNSQQAQVNVFTQLGKNAEEFIEAVEV